MVRRLVVIAAALQYIHISMAATWRTTQVLRATHSPTESFRVFTASLISDYVGDGLISDSPLVQDILGGDTTPRGYALFLESKTRTSMHNCSGMPRFNPAIFNYDFLSLGYLEMVRDTAYNITVLDEFELVLVVVDCSFTQVKVGDASMVRVFNLVRSRKDPADTYLVTVSLNAQDYEIRSHKKRGPALLAMLSLVHDMNAGTMGQFYLMAPTYPYQRSLEFQVYEFVGITKESYLGLRSIPRNPLAEPVKLLITSRKRGLFDREDQSNVRYMYSLLDKTDAKSALTRWEWIGETVNADSWAWVHGLHFFFGLQTIFSMVVLGLVAYQNFLTGKVWIGDPFALVSTASLVMRGVLVVLSWYTNSFWTLFEFAVSNGGKISKTQIVRVHAELVHADVLVVYLSLVGLVSAIIRERVDPSLAIFLFEIIHNYRLSLITCVAAVRNEVVTYSDAVFRLGVAKDTPVVADMSPLRYWSALQIPREKDPTFVAASFLPEMVLLAIIAGLAILRKIYRHCYPEETRQRSSAVSTGDRSVNEKAALTLKGVVTNFELATGAELQTRFGIISDYKNYVYFKGMKFASADGVFCSGYVIANGKLLVSCKDLLSIVLIKVTGSRFTNVYVYEVEGNTVKETARLVYPDTFGWNDLWRLNVTVLL